MSDLSSSTLPSTLHSLGIAMIGSGHPPVQYQHNQRRKPSAQGIWFPTSALSQLGGVADGGKQLQG